MMRISFFWDRKEEEDSLADVFSCRRCGHESRAQRALISLVRGATCFLPLCNAVHRVTQENLDTKGRAGRPRLDGRIIDFVFSLLVLMRARP